MSKLISTQGAACAQQASSMLRAWVLSDERAFQLAVGETLRLCAVEPTGLHEEQVELLKAVAGALRSRPMSAKYESTVHLCINLLVHLAGQPWCSVGMPPGECDIA